MTEPTPSDLLQAALEISEAAASIPLRYFRSGLSVEDKADESPVTIADRETEEHIRGAIAGRFPSHGIFGEEYGRQAWASDLTWVIDPIDGTKSFITGSPLFGMLVAVARDGKPLAGVIRMPALGEVYAGLTGKLRRFAYDCYSFALLASGQIDVVVDFDLKPYDYMALAPVVQAAGGIITDWTGRPLDLSSDGTVLAAGTPALHRAVMDLLA
jgi:inositol-phosphate phosphatase/L-galactose 1-phosphate phosphatase/histidinol-phosphatase